MKEMIEKVDKSDLVKDYSGGAEKVKKKPNPKMILLFVVLIVAGVGTGYLLYLTQGGGADVPSARGVKEEEITVGTTVGIADEKTFRDSAEGKLESGGIDDEGSHHLIRPGGESQYVYLTSSVVDLDKFVGRKVKVWGETFSSKTAGWLMDVGKVKVLE